MEGCLLCLQNHKENVGCIKVNSTHWLEFDIQNIIERHLWPIESVQPSSFICTLCWKELYDFHRFFMTIKAAQAKCFEFDMEPHCLQTSTPSILSFNDDKIKSEHLIDRRSSIEFRYEPEILIEQGLATAPQRKYTHTDIKENNFPNVKLEEVLVYTPETSQTNFCYDDSDETISIATELNENEIFFNQNRNLELTVKDIRHEHLQNTETLEEPTNSTLFITYPKANTGLEEGILDETFIQNVNNGSQLFTSNDLLQITNKHSLKLPSKRGRPRKTFSNTLLRKETVANPTETDNQSSFISTQQEVEYNEDITLKKKKPGRPKNSKKKMWTNSTISRPARKRKLPRKYLTYDVESTNDVKIKKKNIHKELYIYLKSGKRGRPRKILINSMNASNTTVETTLPTELIVNTAEQHQNLCYEKMPKISNGKRGRPRKYFTIDKVRTQDHCGDVPSTSTGKRGRPRKFFTNDIKNTEILKEQTVTSENSMPFRNSNLRIKSMLKNRKRYRNYKDLMRNYIATSVRCMQLFKSKNVGHSESENISYD